MIRVAAVGDIHVGTDSDDRLVDAFAGIEEHADVLLLAKPYVSADLARMIRTALEA